MEATLQEILEARDRRAEKQKNLLDKFGKPLICFTMNIAGPVKYSPLIADGFAMGCKQLEAQLTGIPVLYSQKLPRHTGCEAFYVVDAPAEKVKALTVQIEQGSELGRLFDMDVIAPDGQKLSREMDRQCLVCGKSARECGPRRAHSVEVLQEKTNAILQQAVWDDQSRAIGALAAKAMLYEVCTTPKPGLVDRLGCGSHEDMDIFTFMASTAALQPYLTDCARTGMETANDDPQVTFHRLRYLGKQAEQTMLEATGGVNTQKGAVFTMGVLCAAVGRLDKEDRSNPEKVLDQCAAMCKGLTKELEGITEDAAVTSGQRLYARYGITGIRGQAESGFPAVLHTGLPVLEEGVNAGFSLERAGCGALLAMLTACADTNMLARSDRDTAKAITRQVAMLLTKNRYPDQAALEELDRLFVEKNLSPGGTADLLAATYFLHFLK